MTCMHTVEERCTLQSIDRDKKDLKLVGAGAITYTHCLRAYLILAYSLTLDVCCMVLGKPVTGGDKALGHQGEAWP